MAVSKTGSYIKIDRGLKNNALWLMEKPFTKGQAWVDLLILTQGVEKSREHRGKKQTVKSGNVYTSIYFLADRWGWSRTKVYRFLSKLMIDEMIVVQGWKIDDTTKRTVHRTVFDTKGDTKGDTTNDTTITIVNWALYQYHDTTDDTISDTANDTVHRTEVDTTKRTHKRKNTEKDTEKERNIPPKSPTGDLPPDGEKKHELPDRDKGTLADIPEMFKGRFKTYKQFYDWRYQ